jgi:DNA-binding response OmpR family regulator
MAKKILVVDDDPVVLKLVQSILKANGYETDSATDGLDALVKLKKTPPDLVILDIIMPEVNGYDVCCELRFNKEFVQIPILILTETEQEIDDSIGKRVNIEYLHKPVVSSEVLDKVKYLLSKAK